MNAETHGGGPNNPDGESFGGQLWHIVEATPSILVAIVAGWITFGVTDIVADEYLGQLLAMVDFYVGGSTIVAFTPRAMIGSPLLIALGVVSGVGLIVGWFVVVNRYYSAVIDDRTTWRNDIRTVLQRVRGLLVYLLFTGAVVTVGFFLLIIPGIYLAGRLLPGATFIVGERKSVRDALHMSVAATADHQLAVTLWSGIIICIGIAVAVLLALWIALPITAAGLAALSVAIVANHRDLLRGDSNHGDI